MTASRTALLAHPSAELYGSDRMFAESVAALRENGWRVVVALPEPGPLVDLLLATGAEVEFCRTAVLRKAALRPLGALVLLLECLRSVLPTARLIRATRPDVVFVSTVTAPLWFILPRLFGLRVIADVHEAEDDVPRPIRIALAAPLLAAHTVVVNSAATRRSVIGALPRLNDRVRLIYNGVGGPPRPPVRPDGPADPPRLVLVGRLSPRKGTDIAVRAVRLLHEAGHPVRLDLVGDAFAGYEWFVEELRVLIAEAGLQEHVRFLGFRPDVWQSYAESDIAVVPSRVEPFGNTGVEAQLAEVPVVVSDAQGLPETVADGRFGVVVAREDPSAIADAVLGILDDWPSARERATAARLNAEVRFAPARYRTEIARVVNEVTGP